MTSPRRKERKLRLKVGQVVKARHFKGWLYGLVESIQLPTTTVIDGEVKHDPLLYCVGFECTPVGIAADFDPWFKESELRPLTKREQGR